MEVVILSIILLVGYGVANKTRYKFKCFNMITRVNELKTLTKHISCKCKCNFDGRKCNSNQKWNNSKSQCECKNPRKRHVCKKDYIWKPSTCTCKNGKHLESIIDDSVIKV